MSTPESVLISLGSNLGDRRYHLRRAVRELNPAVRIVRLSSIHESEAVDAPPGSPPFLNMVAVGYTTLSPEKLIDCLLDIERRLGRLRSVRNAPRTIDLDLVLLGANLRRTSALTLPHPRYRRRRFVMAPLHELRLPWRDPVSGEAIS